MKSEVSNLTATSTRTTTMVFYLKNSAATQTYSQAHASPYTRSHKNKSREFPDFDFTVLLSEAGLQQLDTVVWPNGKASDYESEDSGFDPQHDHIFALQVEWAYPQAQFKLSLSLLSFF